MKKIIFILIVLLAPSSLVAAVKDFKLGVEYTWVNTQNTVDGKGLPEVYAEMGATLTKPQDERVYMESVQKECGGPFDWSVLDRMVKRWQNSNIDFLVVLATKYDKEPSKYTPEEISCYQEYVRATVDRYDLDGIDDMPGLLRPVIYWQIDSEFGTGFFDKRDPISVALGLDWKDPGGEYVKMLEMATPIIRKANPNAKVLTISWQTRGLWVDTDGEKRTYANRAEWQKNYNSSAAHIFKVLGRPDLFDITCFNSIEDWSAIIGITRFCNDAMKARGYQPKPIWMSDLSYSIDPIMTFSILLYPYHGNAFNIFDPKGLTRYWKAYNLLSQMAKNPNPYEDWTQEMQASFTAKAIVTAIGEGVEAANIHAVYSNDFPWKLWGYRIGGGTFGWCSLIETDGSRGFMPVKYKAVYYMMKELLPLLKSYDTVVCNSSPAQDTVRIHRYDFTKTADSKKLIVLWCDNRIGRFPDEPVSSIKYSFILDRGIVPITIQKILTRVGQANVVKLVADADDGNSDGQIMLTVDETPSLIIY